MRHNETILEPLNLFSSFELLEEVYDLLKNIKSIEDCRLEIEFKTDSLHYYVRGAMPSNCYIYPVYNHTKSSLALNDYNPSAGIGFFNSASQPLIRRLNEIFSIDSQRHEKFIYQPIMKDVIELLLSFKNTPNDKKVINWSFTQAAEKSFKMSQKQDPFFILFQTYILKSQIQKISASTTKLSSNENGENSETEKNIKTFKI